MIIDSTKTVRELAVEHPAALRVFEKLGIDYHCGGSVLIADACGEAGLTVAEFSQLLEKAKGDVSASATAGGEGRAAAQASANRATGFGAADGR